MIKMHRGALVPWLEQRDHGRDVRVDRVRQAIETAERRDRFHTRIRAQHLLDLRDDAVGALERRAVGQADSDEEHALILVWQESCGYLLEERAGCRVTHRQGDQRECRSTDQRLDAHDVPSGRPRERTVESAERAHQRSARVLLRLQNQRTQRRTQRQCVERRQEHGSGDRERELSIDLTGDPSEKGDRDEHRGEDARNRDDRTRHFLHCLDGRVARAHAEVDLVLHRLDDHDCIVNDNADRQHEPEHAGHVDGEAEERKQRERSNDGHWHGE